MNELVYSLTIMLARGLALLIIGLGIYAGLRKRCATTQNFLWRLLLMALVAIPLLTFLPNAWRIDLSPEVPPLTVSMEALRPEAANVEELPPLVIDEPEEHARALNWASSLSWQQSIAIAWAVGFLAIVCRFLLGYVRLMALRRRCQELPASSPWVRFLKEEQVARKYCRRIRIFSDQDVPVPMIFGSLRPSLLLPASILEATEEERTMIVRHELAHAIRQDGLFNIIRVMATAIHSPNPLAWFASRHLRISEEQAVDDTVVASGTRPARYAELLASIASGARFGLPAQSMTQPSTLRTRVSHLLNGKQDRNAPGHFFRASIILTISSAFLLLGSLSAQDPENDWVTEAYAIDSEKWARSISGLETDDNPAMTLLERSGIHLAKGASAIYESSSRRLLTRAPKDTSKKIKAFIATTLNTVLQSAVQVEIQYRLIQHTKNPPTAATAPGISISGVLTQEQLSTMLRAWQSTPGVDLLASPKLVTRSGKTGSIQVGSSGNEQVHLSLLPIVEGEDTIDLTLSFDPPTVERKTTTNVTIKNGMTVAFRDPANSKRVHLVTARLINAATGTPILSKPATKKTRTIVLDAGHGGIGSGGTYGNIQEKDLALDFTHQLRRLLEDHGYEVVLTRQTDVYVTLAGRVNTGNEIDNALFNLEA